MEVSKGKRILDILKAENYWLTFDELYGKAQIDCDWVLFASLLEQLVEQGQVQYFLPYGADVGYYGIGEL